MGSRCRQNLTVGSLSNHDDDGNKNITNLHIWQWKNNTFARFVRAFFIFWHFADVLVLSTTWKDLFCSCVDDVSIWWQMFNCVFLSLKRWFQLNSRIVRTYFASVMTLNNWEMIPETRSYSFRWRSRCRRRRVCLSSLVWKFHVVVSQTTSKNCIKKRAARAARLSSSLIQPVKSLICGAVFAVAVIVS